MCVIKHTTRLSWHVLDTVTSWQGHSKDIELTLKLCFFLHFAPFSLCFSSFKNAVRSLWSLSVMGA